MTREVNEKERDSLCYDTYHMAQYYFLSKIMSRYTVWGCSLVYLLNKLNHWTPPTSMFFFCSPFFQWREEGYVRIGSSCAVVLGDVYGNLYIYVLGKDTKKEFPACESHPSYMHYQALNSSILWQKYIRKLEAKNKKTRSHMCPLLVCWLSP